MALLSLLTSDSAITNNRRQRGRPTETKNHTFSAERGIIVGTYDPGGGAFALFLRPNRGAFGSLSVPTPGEFAIQEKKMLMPGGGMGAAGID